mgnify:CR=1 FL=1
MISQRDSRPLRHAPVAGLPVVTSAIVAIGALLTLFGTIGASADPAAVPSPSAEQPDAHRELACARCHDHKFDPIPTEDYYAMAGIFRSTLVQRGTTNKNLTPRPLAGSDANKYKTFNQKLDELVATSGTSRHVVAR